LNLRLDHDIILAYLAIMSTSAAPFQARLALCEAGPLSTNSHLRLASSL
jgi:hypothetical protein